MTLLVLFNGSGVDVVVSVEDLPTPVTATPDAGTTLGSRSTGAGVGALGLVGASIVGGGNVLFSPQSSVFVNGKPLVVTGATSTGHGEGLHNTGSHIIIGTSNIFVNGVRAARTGDFATCGHPMISLEQTMIG